MDSLFRRFIGATPGYERSKALRAEVDRIAVKPAPPTPSTSDVPLVPEIRAGRIVRWVTLN